MRFGLWTVIGRAAVERGRGRWTCRCECGTVRDVLAQTLRRCSRSCGCARLQHIAEAVQRHERAPRRTPDGRRSPTYNSWRGMLSRCQYRRDPYYADYGGRGIAVCARWRGDRGFEHFLADMGERPEGTTLDRKDVNGNYEPGNCRWATPKEQRANQRPRASRDDDAETWWGLEEDGAGAAPF
ncbi:MAG: hypothetical protein F9K40_09355 [Kofleriaceae bacterium]|nr:MAG: hypothetical protein F9K40_09355 [Kofleriaceae bacterium]